MKNKNKKGAEKIMSMYWFAILFIVAGGIYGMVTTFYHHPYDVRSLEANVLTGKVADCISYGGELNSNLFLGDTFNEDFKKIFLEECKLNFNVEDQWETEQYLVVVDFFDLDEKKVFDFNYGNLNLKSSCEIAHEDYEKLARCVKKRFYSTFENNQYLVEVLTIVRKTEKNVK